MHNRTSSKTGSARDKGSLFDSLPMQNTKLIGVGTVKKISGLLESALQHSALG